MASSSQNRPATDSAETLRELVGNDPTATFEDDPTFVNSNPTDSASSENLGAATEGDDTDLAEDGDVDESDDVIDSDEDDFEEDTEEDEEDEEDDLDDDVDDEDEEDDAEEAGTPLRASGDLDDDSNDDGREDAGDEDDLNAQAEDDLDDSSLDPVEAETLRNRLDALPVSAAEARLGL